MRFYTRGRIGELEAIPIKVLTRSAGIAFCNDLALRISDIVNPPQVDTADDQPKCGHIWKKGANKDKRCVGKAKHNGFCTQHKKYAPVVDVAPAVVPQLDVVAVAPPTVVAPAPAIEGILNQIVGMLQQMSVNPPATPYSYVPPMSYDGPATPWTGPSTPAQVAKTPAQIAHDKKVVAQANAINLMKSNPLFLKMKAKNSGNTIEGGVAESKDSN